MPYASEAMARALEALVRFYRSGETADRRAYDIAWVADRDSAVDTINGFVEVYLDARGRKGAWEALVYYVNRHKTAGHRADRHARAVVRGPHAVGAALPQAARHRRDRPGHRRGHRDRRLRAGDPDRDQPAERPGDPRDLRQQVGVAVERRRRLREVDLDRLPHRVRVGRRGSGARRAVGRVRERAHDEPARGHRARIGPGRGVARRHAGGGAQGAVLDDRGSARRPGGALLRRRSGDGRLRPRRGRGSRARWCAPSTRPTRATRWCSSGGSARARRSRKTTCATAS